MTIASPKTSPLIYSKIVGVLYLLIFFLGPFAFFMGRNGVVVANNPSATIINLLASEKSFRYGMAAETLIIFIEIIISALLYFLLKPISRPLALASTLARFAQAILQAVNLFTAVPALIILGNTNYLSAFSKGQIDTIALLFMDINSFVIIIWGLIFGFHLLILGYLIYKSTFWPRVIGILIFVASIGYLLQSYGHLFIPQYDVFLGNVVVALSIPGELIFTLWLLIKGINITKWNEQAREL